MTACLRRGLVLFVCPLIAGGIVLTACGSKPTPQQAAKAQATTACSDLLSLGNQVLAGQAVTSDSAEGSLRAGATAANKAATLDSSWADFAGTVQDIQKYLESGERQGLGGTLDDLAVDCRPLVSPPSSSSTAG
jgi:hypothetical protein